MICSSNFCSVPGGREFTPDENAQGVALRWCDKCVMLAGQMNWFAQQTAAMIRNKYREYHETNLPTEVKLILTQFARELIAELGEEEL